MFIYNRIKEIAWPVPLFRMHFVLQDRKIFVERGDSWCLPGNMEHGVEVMEDSVVIEVFSPVRKEYLD